MFVTFRAPALYDRKEVTMGRGEPLRRRDGGNVDRRLGATGPLTRAQLESVRRRDPDALGALFEAYVDRIHGLALRMLRERPAAEDVTQEVFLRVYRACHQLDPARDPGHWLLAITANLCRERWRRRRRRGEDRQLSLDGESSPGAQVPDAGPDPAAAAAAAQRKQRLEVALGILPEPLRLVVVLHSLVGLSHEEIAEVLEENPAAVRKRYSRALAKLRDILQDVGP
jgi:RNA polymerase sigma-70 factor (ECF subfamily)